MNRFPAKVVWVLVVIAMPVFLVLTMARVVVADWYPRYEYAKAVFPPDRYGFTQQQRLEYALATYDFLQMPEPPEAAIAALEALRLPGSGEPFFAPEELDHMVDVKRLTDALWVAHLISGIIVIVGPLILIARKPTRYAGFRSLFWGGAVTTLLLVALVVFVLLSWRTVFVTFHDIFFPPGSWTFDYSSSLIRMFPDKYFFDAGTILAVGALLLGLLVMGIGYLGSKMTTREVI